MKETPDSEYKWRVLTAEGVRWLNEAEMGKLLDAIFDPLPATPPVGNN